MAKEYIQGMQDPMDYDPVPLEVPGAPWAWQNLKFTIAEDICRRYLHALIKYNKGQIILCEHQIESDWFQYLINEQWQPDVVEEGIRKRAIGCHGKIPRKIANLYAPQKIKKEKKHRK